MVQILLLGNCSGNEDTLKLEIILPKIDRNQWIDQKYHMFSPGDQSYISYSGLLCGQSMC